MSVLSPRRAIRPAAPRPVAPTAPVTVSEPGARLIGVLAVAAIAVIHILDAPGTFAETRYLFWLYMALVAGAIPVALALVSWRSPLAWAAAAALAAGPLIGFILSRTTGLPGSDDDIGNWLEPLGLMSLFVESGLLALAATRVATALTGRGAGE